MATKDDVQETEQKIFEAVEKSDVELLKNCLSQTKNVNIYDNNFMTPLQHACYKGHKEIVQMLLDQVNNQYLINYTTFMS